MFLKYDKLRYLNVLLLLNSYLIKSCFENFIVYVILKILVIISKYVYI